MFLALACLLTGCEMDDFSDGETSGNVKAVVPTGHGRGTQQRPYTPDDLLEMDGLPSGGAVWVMGYAVGSTETDMENALFDVPTGYDRNILLSSDSLCETTEGCIPVELTKDAMQQRFSLLYQPECFRRFIVIRGTPGAYFDQPGIRKADAAYWLDNIDLTHIAPPREDWEIVDKEF